MNVAVYYESRYGSTKQYAEWIAQATKADLFDIHASQDIASDDYDTVVFCTYFYCFKIKGANVLDKRWESWQDKNVILVTVSGSPPNSPAVREVYEKDIPAGIRSSISWFPLHGRKKIESMKTIDRVLMRFGTMMEKDEAIKKKMMENVDGVKKENILPVVERINARTAA